jgi:hypothetical protein
MFSMIGKVGGSLFRWLVGVVLVGWLSVGCAASPSATPTATNTNPNPVAPTIAPLPTLYPSPTPLVRATDTPLPRPTTAVASPTPFDFSQPVLKLQYSIPALGLDRRLEGTANATIRLLDVATGQETALANQSRVLLQLQDALETIELSELPADCDRCVQISYDLPLRGTSGTGWLQDDVLLASIENFFAVWLGPYFPAETQIGLHRSASAYNVAQTLAVLTDGRMWRWQATDGEIAEPVAVDGVVLQRLADLVTAVSFSRLEPEYRTACPNTPRETLSIGSETPWQLSLQCPAYSLPLPLAPLYTTLDSLLQPSLDPTRNLPQPAPLLPLSAVVYFQRPDGATLTLGADGQLTAQASDGITSTAQLFPPELADLVQQLTTSDVLPRGVQILIDPEVDVANLETDTLLLVRGELGVYEFAWSDNVGQALLPAIVRLDELLVAQVGFLPLPTPTPEAP